MTSDVRRLVGLVTVGLVLAIALLVLTSLANAQGCTESWTGDAGTSSWDTASNWSQNRAPISTDVVCITAPSAQPYTVVVGNETIDVAGLTVGGPGAARPSRWATPRAAH